MYVALFLHFYQPPVQKKEIVARVAKEAYIPIVAAMRKNTRARVTLNISATLLRQLDKLGYTTLIADIAALVREGRIELVGSSAYHAFLPGLPEDIVTRQIAVQEQLLRHYLGKRITLHGFFAPEMAITPAVAGIVNSAGYRYMIADRYAVNAPDDGRSVYIDAHGMRFVLRERAISYKLISHAITKPAQLQNEIQTTRPDALYTVLGLDGETFGHHYARYDMFLQKLFAYPDITLFTLSQALELPLKKHKVAIRKSSWTLMDERRSKLQPFIRWMDPANEIHTKQWKLTQMACDCARGERLLSELDKALFSCQYWWACARPWWHVEMIEAGAHGLLDVIIHSSETAAYKRRALDLYHDIIATAFDWMRSGKMQKRVDKEHEHLTFPLTSCVNA